MNVLLLGAAGQLGQAFVNHPDFASFDALCLARSELDICNYDAVSVLIADVKPAIVINCAAYTAVDAAEQNKQLCLAINSDAVANLARQCQQHKALLIQFSTDYVFDGKKASPYTEDDSLNPINHYGMTKWLAEQQVQQHCEKYLILRTSWLFSQYGHNFYRTMLNLAQSTQQISVINDQFGCPTYAGDVAKAVIDIIRQYQHKHYLPYGTYHLSSEPATNWYDFAKAIFTVNQLDVTLCPISTQQWPAAAVRPVNAVLNSQKLRSAMGIALPAWQNALIKLTGI